VVLPRWVPRLGLGQQPDPLPAYIQLPLYRLRLRLLQRIRALEELVYGDRLPELGVRLPLERLELVPVDTRFFRLLSVFVILL
jgi:hypothetical protein